jgi:hypothetical protein
MKFNTLLLTVSLCGFSGLAATPAHAFDLGNFRPIKPVVFKGKDFSKALHQNDGKVLNRGNGCPSTVSATFSPDRKSVSVLFDDFTAEAGVGVGRNSDTKSCEVSIPLLVPDNMSVSVQQVNYRGFYSVPQGGRFELTSMTSAIPRLSFLALFPFGTNAIMKESIDLAEHKKVVVGSSTDNFDLVLDNTLPQKSACGGIARLNILTTLKVTSNNSGDQTIATVDTMDTFPQDDSPNRIAATYRLKYDICRR